MTSLLHDKHIASVLFIASILFLLAVPVIAVSINHVSGDQGITVAANAAANNMQPLSGPNAILAAGLSDAAVQSPVTSLAQFTINNRSVTAGSGAYALVGAPGSTVYYRSAASSGQSSRQSSGQSIIDLAVFAAFNKTKTVPVIIQLNSGVDSWFEHQDGQSHAQSYSQSHLQSSAKPDILAKIQAKRQKFLAAKQQLLAAGIKSKRDLEIVQGVATDVDATTLQQLGHNSLIKKVWLDVPVQAVLDDSDAQIHATAVWNQTDAQGNSLRGNGITIAVIDTGVDYLHPDLGGCFGPGCKVVGGYDFVNSDNDPMDDQGHGTHVAATAAGNGVLHGVAPDATIYAYKVLNAYGSGYSSAIIAAIQRAADPNNDGDTSDHLDIGTLSLGGTGNPDDAMSLAIDNATAAGVVFTIAAGNSGANASINSPGTARTAITVAAACSPTQIGSNSYCAQPIASFSSRGPLIWNNSDLQKPDVSAPGVLICAARWSTSFPTEPTCIDSQHVQLSGTSMATPHVAGAAALILQAYPGITPAQVKQLLKTTADTLNLTYDAQGAGLIDLSRAIPGSTIVAPAPDVWSLTTDPTIATNVFVQNFSVGLSNVSLLGNDSTVFITAQLLIPGVNFSSNVQSVDLSNASAQFSAIVTVDNNNASAGSYSGMILLSTGNGSVVGSVPILLTILPTFAVSPHSIDFGVDNPSLDAWQSGSQTIAVTNYRSDVAQTITIGETPITGVTFQIPASITVPAGSTVNVPVAVFVNNSLAPNSRYSSTVTFTDGPMSASGAISFTKYHVLTIQIPDADISSSSFIYAYVHDRVSTSYYYQLSANSTDLFLNTPGVYDAIVDYYGTNGIFYTVVTEGISVNGSVVINVSKAQAVHAITYNLYNTTGGLLGPYSAPGTRRTMYNANTNLALGWSISWMYPTNYISDMSSNYTHVDFYNSQQPASTLIQYSSKFTGLSSDLVFNKTPQGYTTTQVQFNPNVAPNSTIEPVIQSCIMDGMCAGFTVTSASNPWPTMPLTMTLYMDPTIPIPFHVTYLDNQYVAPTFDPVTHSRWAWYFNLSPQQNLPIPSYDDKIYAGLGPSVWYGEFLNSPNTVQFEPYYFNYLAMATVVRQDFTVAPYPAFTYTLSNASGQVLQMTTAGGNDYSRPVVTSTTVVPGQYMMSATIPYDLQTQTLNGFVSTAFDTRASDPNPPAFRKLYVSDVYANATINLSVRSQTYDPAASLDVAADINPVGGVLSNVSASYSLDGLSFTPAQVQLLNTTYHAIVPAGLNASYILVQIRAIDDSNNSLTYTMTLPAQGSAVIPNATIPAQIYYPVSIAVTGHGTVIDNLTGTVCSSSCTLWVPMGALVQFTANAGANASFLNWNGNCPGTGVCTLAVYGPQSIGAVFADSSVVALSISGAGTVTSVPAGLNCAGTNCTAAFVYGTVVTLTASPAYGYSFAGWTGACSGNATCSFSANASPGTPIAVGASFIAIPNVTVGLTVSGRGWVVSSPAGINCTTNCSALFLRGTRISLNATAASQYWFVGWNNSLGDASCTGSQCLLDGTRNITVLATFAPVLNISITAPANNTQLPKNGLTLVRAVTNDLANITLVLDSGSLKTCTLVTICDYNLSNNKVASGTHTISAQGNGRAGFASTSITIRK